MTDLPAVRVYVTRGDAEVARARLGAEGIEALVIADNEGGLNPGFFANYGVRVVVRAQDLDRARAALGDDSVSVLVHPEAAEAMIQHGRFDYPNEACGLIAVDETGGVCMVYCLTNVDRSALRFTVDPGEHFHAWKHAERNGWRIGGSFHSHPESRAAPSPADVAGALDPSWIYLIVGPIAAGAPEVRAYRIVHGDVAEITIVDG